MRDTVPKQEEEKRRDAPVYTTLMKAAAQGDEATIVHLLEYTMKGEHKNKNKKLPVHFNTTQQNSSGAAAEEVEETEGIEMEDEAVDLFAKDRKGRTALDWARLGRHAGCAQLLEEAMAADIEKRRKENER
jgi:ankyrin repeat protein